MVRRIILAAGVALLLALPFCPNAMAACAPYLDNPDSRVLRFSCSDSSPQPAAKPAPPVALAPPLGQHKRQVDQGQFDPYKEGQHESLDETVKELNTIIQELRNERTMAVSPPLPLDPRVNDNRGPKAGEEGLQFRRQDDEQQAQQSQNDNGSCVSPYRACLDLHTHSWCVEHHISPNPPPGCSGHY